MSDSKWEKEIIKDMLKTENRLWVLNELCCVNAFFQAYFKTKLEYLLKKNIDV